MRTAIILGILLFITLIFCAQSMSLHNYEWLYYDGRIDVDSYIYLLNRFLYRIPIFGFIIFIASLFLLKKNNHWQIRLIVFITFAFDIYFSLKSIYEHYYNPNLKEVSLWVESDFGYKWAHLPFYLPLIVIVFVIIALAIPYIYSHFKTQKVDKSHLLIP